MNAMALIDTAVLARLPAEDLTFLEWQMRWSDAARDNQIPPANDWTECGYQAGRGFGKTRVGAEWLGRSVYEDPSGFDSAVICPTFSDVKFTAFEGESGLLSVIPPDLILEYNKSDLTIRMKNVGGTASLIRGFTAEKPERLRGPQHCRGWLDEVAAWLRDEETWDMYMFGLRLGLSPQTLWTSTPKPKELIRKITQPKDGRVIIRGSTYDNEANLPRSFFDQIAQYEGTTLGRQELSGELIDPEEAGIIRRSWMRLWPADRPLPKLEFIILSLDTAFTEETYDKKSGADLSACAVMGVFRIKEETHLMVLDCWSERMGMPDLIKRVKKELNVAYGDDQDAAMVTPMFGSSKPRLSGKKPDLCLIEDKGSGISLRQMLESEGIQAYAYNPGRADKLARLHMVSHVFARRRVWLPESNAPERKGKPRNWCEPMLAQLCAFTGTGSIKHDDYVDAVSQAVRLCLDRNLVTVTKPVDPKQVTRDYSRPKGNPYSQ